MYGYTRLANGRCHHSDYHYEPFIITHFICVIIMFLVRDDIYVFGSFSRAWHGASTM